MLEDVHVKLCRITKLDLGHVRQKRFAFPEGAKIGSMGSGIIAWCGFGWEEEDKR